VGAGTARPVQTQYQRKQEYANSCGAASLLCASKELGKTNLPTVDGEFRWQGQPLDTRTSAAEQAIYSVSSGTANRNGDLKNEGYSQPDKLIQAADRLGLKSQVQVAPGIHGKVLETINPGLVTRLNEAGVEINRGPEQPLNENQRRLRVVRANVGVLDLPKGPVGLHYVLERPNGSVMDPATGFDYNNLSTLNKTMAASSQGIEGTNGWLKGSYTDTGISIIVEPR
jgi:cysteine protease IpaJ